MTMRCYVIRHTHNPVSYLKFRHTQAYSSPIQVSHIMGYLEPCVTLVTYSESCHIQNPRYIQNPVTYWELCHIQNFAIFRFFVYLGPVAYSKPYLIRNIQAYSIMIFRTTLTLFFFFLILHNFQRWFLTTMTSIPMLDWDFLNNTQSLKITL